jgi:DNA-binding IclR family transcriptional regulator
VLSAFDGGDAALTNRSLAERTGFTRPTVARLTRTLAALGYLRYDVPTTSYRLAPGVLRFAYPFLTTLPIRQIGRPLMQRLADHARGAVSMGMRDRLDIVVIETCVDVGTTTWRPDIGVARPLPITAYGRAYFAGAEDAERAEILAAIRADGRYDANATIAALDEEAERYTRNGYCVARDTARRGIHAVAVPLRGRTASDLMVINCAVASYNLTDGQLESDIAPRLIDVARSIEQSTGTHDR